jgi:GT2 family glycosyltransferase
VLNNRDTAVSIILLNYNGHEDTIACLQSLEEISYATYNIVIVDNASPDDSMEKIEEYLKSESSKDYVVFSSPDEAMKSNNKQQKYCLLQSGHNGGYGVILPKINTQ